MARKRAIFYHAVEYAVELGHLAGNPVASIEWRAPKVTEAVNPRMVINYGQARPLFDAVRLPLRPAAGRVLRGHVLRRASPGEVVDLRKEALSLPVTGWGELYLSTSAPAAGRWWSESGTRREPRQLKHRGAVEDAASPLARRPYDLRHAAVSTWLYGGVPAPQVAAWAGHSVDVLLRVYAKCVAGQDAAARRRVEEALRAGA